MSEKKSWNSTLVQAKKVKNDEFYTQYNDIEKEVNAYLDYDSDVFRGKTILLPCDDPEWSNFTKFFAQNFERFGLKKLISTSYARSSKEYKDDLQLSLLEINSPKYDQSKTDTKGKIYTLTKDNNADGKVNFADFEWEYLMWDGDFRSEEVCRLRDEADIIITNPPFSLFREFLAWIFQADKQFVIIGSMNAIANKETFPLIKNNKMWLGNGFHAGNAYFSTPSLREYADGVYDSKTGLLKFRNCCWFTNIDHGRRHQKLPLMTTQDNLRFSKHKNIKGRESYQKYDNYDVIEVSFTDAIPSDYDGVMWVPVSFLDKYNPDQFEILGSTQRGCHDEVPDTKKYDDYWEVRPNGEKTGSSGGKTNENGNLVWNDGKKNYFINSEGHIVQSTYSRIFIKHKK